MPRPLKHPPNPNPVRKNGSGLKVAEDRRNLFVEAYLTNGRNGSQAAITAGYAAHSASETAYRLLRDPRVSSQIEARIGTIVADAQLSTDRWAKEMAAIGHVDPGELYDAAGNLIPIHMLPEHVRRAIASVKPNSDGSIEIKLWDKNAALANIGKHLGLFDADNRQRVNAIQVNVQLLG